MLIEIPEGKTSMTLPDGRVIPFPENAKTVDIPDNILSLDSQNDESFKADEVTQGINWSKTTDVEPAKKTPALEEF